MGIKIQDVAYVRFSAPDLDQMEAFLTEFGMLRAERTRDALYMRGLDGDPFLHVTHRGEPRFLVVGFEAASIHVIEVCSALRSPYPAGDSSATILRSMPPKNRPR